MNKIKYKYLCIYFNFFQFNTLVLVTLSLESMQLSDLSVTHSDLTPPRDSCYLLNGYKEFDIFSAIYAKNSSLRTFICNKATCISVAIAFTTTDS